MSRVDRAIETAITYHEGQRDKAGMPYILHPLRVGAAGLTEAEQIVGFLHDTLEDTSITVSFLIRAFGCEITNAVCALSRGWYFDNPHDPENRQVIYFKQPGTGYKREKYYDFIRRGKLNELAAIVKPRDIWDNLNRLDNIRNPEERDHLNVKYRTALEILGGK